MKDQQIIIAESLQDVHSILTSEFYEKLAAGLRKEGIPELTNVANLTDVLKTGSQEERTVTAWGLVDGAREYLVHDSTSNIAAIFDKLIPQERKKLAGYAGVQEAYQGLEDSRKYAGQTRTESTGIVLPPAGSSVITLTPADIINAPMVLTISYEGGNRQYAIPETITDGFLEQIIQVTIGVEGETATEDQTGKSAFGRKTLDWIKERYKQIDAKYDELKEDHPYMAKIMKATAYAGLTALIIGLAKGIAHGAPDDGASEADKMVQVDEANTTDTMEQSSTDSGIPPMIGDGTTQANDAHLPPDDTSKDVGADATPKPSLWTRLMEWGDRNFNSTGKIIIPSRSDIEKYGGRTTEDFFQVALEAGLVNRETNMGFRQGYKDPAVDVGVEWLTQLPKDSPLYLMAQLRTDGLRVGGTALPLKLYSKDQEMLRLGLNLGAEYFDTPGMVSGGHTTEFGPVLVYGKEGGIKAMLIHDLMIGNLRSDLGGGGLNGSRTRAVVNCPIGRWAFEGEVGHDSERFKWLSNKELSALVRGAYAFEVAENPARAYLGLSGSSRRSDRPYRGRGGTEKDLAALLGVQVMLSPSMGLGVDLRQTSRLEKAAVGFYLTW